MHITLWWLVGFSSILLIKVYKDTKENMTIPDVFLNLTPLDLIGYTIMGLLGPIVPIITLVFALGYLFDHYADVKFKDFLKRRSDK